MERMRIERWGEKGRGRVLARGTEKRTGREEGCGGWGWRSKRTKGGNTKKRRARSENGREEMTKKGEEKKKDNEREEARTRRRWTERGEEKGKIEIWRR